jgi:predicted ATPase
LIEEPELSLYPESQRSLINGLVKKCFVNKPSDYNMTIMLATHSPYILNHINLLIKAGEKGLLEEGAQLHYNDVDLFEVADGYINNLKIKNSTVIDTRSLSEPISNIYSRYNEINKL